MTYGKIKIIVFIFCCTISSSFAQTDSLISYDVASGLNHVYAPVIFDTSIIFDHTNWNYGSEDGYDSLYLNPPSNTFNNSGFTYFIPAHDFFSINDYPIRTAVKIFFIKNDSLKQKCSGILVAKDYALTACHCIGKYDSNKVFRFQDSILVAPGYDDGNINPLFNASPGIKYYIFKSNMIEFWQKDIALIKLKNDLGIKTGWVGIAFSKDDKYYKNRVFQEFSYPGVIDPADSTKIYNGDTLYYNYGTLDMIGQKWLGYNILTIPGQSGSSLIYTDNKEYYSLGTLIYSSGLHIRITPEIFYAFKSILNESISSVSKVESRNNNFYLSNAYPNPFNPSTKISYSIPKTGFVQLKVYDMLGREVKTLVNGIQGSGVHIITFNGEDLASGIYIIRMQCGNYITNKKVVLLK